MFVLSFPQGIMAGGFFL